MKTKEKKQVKTLSSWRRMVSICKLWLFVL